MANESTLVPSTFVAPLEVKFSRFLLVPLNRKVGAQDFDAVMSSIESLQGIFGADFDWPRKTMTLNESLDSLKVHEKEFAENEAFAYSVFNDAGNKCLGSVYIDPSRSHQHDCEVHYWLRNDSDYLLAEFINELKQWLAACWPFKNIAYPGREISWNDWKKLLNTPHH